VVGWAWSLNDGESWATVLNLYVGESSVLVLNVGESWVTVTILDDGESQSDGE